MQCALKAKRLKQNSAVAEMFRVAMENPLRTDVFWAGKTSINDSDF